MMTKITLKVLSIQQKSTHIFNSICRWLYSLELLHEIDYNFEIEMTILNEVCNVFKIYVNKKRTSINSTCKYRDKINIISN